MKAATETNDTHGSHEPFGSPGTGGRPAGRRTGVTVAAVVALTATLTLLPPSRADRADDGPQPQKVAAEAAPAAAEAEAEDCVEPERSLRPSPQLDEGPTIDKIKDRGHLIVGIDQSSFRWGYRVGKTMQGFDIDLARAIAENILGSPDDIVFRAIPTNQRVDALNTTTDSGVDLVVRTMTINCARSEQVAFSTAYFEAGQQVLAPKEGSDITGYDKSLSGKRVCSADSTTAYDELVKNSFGAVFKDKHDGTPQDEDILTVPNQLDCLVRLQMGEVDAIVTDNALAAGQAAQDPAVELVGEPFTKEYYGIAAKLGNDDLVRRVNHVLEEYRAGGADSPWMTSYEKWLEAGLPGIKAPPEAKYKD
ncbi:glutamate ABC transporter substrate-binding protein [Streptomyces sp. NBC_01506]|uniref:glutamate ABC transporter substrate-binding protein n=1 Tax=Streptomyces sp. NBC_01506 TaxID=2903887 RepID=UPI00386645CA